LLYPYCIVQVPKTMHTKT